MSEKKFLDSGGLNLYDQLMKIYIFNRLNDKANCEAVSNGDFNEVVLPGFYTMKRCNNCPLSDDEDQGYYTLIVARSSEVVGDEYYVHQIALVEGTNDIYVRHIYGTVWSKWEHLPSRAELDKKYEIPNENADTLLQYIETDTSGNGLQLNYDFFVPFFYAGNDGGYVTLENVSSLQFIDSNGFKDIDEITQAVVNLQNNGGGSSGGDSDGSSGYITVDSVLSSTSTNPVQNKVVNSALNGKSPTSHASSNTTYGVGTTANYGHLKLSDSVTTSSSTGTAATPKAVKTAYDKAVEAYNLADMKYEANSSTQTFLDGIEQTDATLWYLSGDFESDYIYAQQVGVKDIIFNGTDGLKGFLSASEIADAVIEVQDGKLDYGFISNGFVGIDEVTQAVIDLQNESSGSVDLSGYMPNSGGTFSGLVTHSANIALGSGYYLYPSSYNTHRLLYTNGTNHYYGYDSSSTAMTNYYGYQASSGAVTNYFGYRNYANASNVTTNYFGRGYSNTSYYTGTRNYFGMYAAVNTFGYNTATTTNGNYFGNTSYISYHYGSEIRLGSATSYPVYMQGTTTYKVVGTTTGYNTKIHVSATEPSMSDGDIWFKIPV